MDTRTGAWTPEAGHDPDAAEWLSASAAAAALGVSQRTVRRAIARGDLPASKHGGVYRIAPAALGCYQPPYPVSDPTANRSRRQPSRPELSSMTQPKTASALPRPLTRLIGREAETAVAATALGEDGVRLLTLTGPGGVGKTRLAIEVATRVPHSFPDGVAFVELGPISDAALVAAVVTRALGLRETGRRPLGERLRAFLRDKHLLIVLDNFEQVVEAAPMVADLLAAGPGVAVLVTSRVRLRLNGECEQAVAPLALATDHGESSVDAVATSPAVQLFVARARAVRADFALTAADAPTVAGICRRLDGLPLAIELAAARSRGLPPSALLARLERRLPVLIGGGRDQPPRLRTMRAAIAWSHDLLTAEERALFRRLAVFVGGCTLDAATAVAGDPDHAGDDVFEGIAALVEANLLRQEPESGADPRYAMLETVREYALEQLAASGEEDEIRRRLAHRMETIAGDAEPHLRGPDQVAWLDRLESELPNVRATLGWLRKAGGASGGLRLAAALWVFWVVRDRVPEGRGWLERFLAAESADTGTRMRALTALGDLAERMGDYAEATTRSEDALQLARALGDRLGEATALRGLGNIAIARGEVARHDLGDEASAEREFCRAESLLGRGADLAGSLGDGWGAAKALHWWAVAVGLRGDGARASVSLEEAAAAFRRLGDQRQVCNVLWNLGSLALVVNDLPRAGATFAESLALAHRVGYRWHAGLCLVALASVASGGGGHEHAARLLGAAEALRIAAGEPLRPSVQAMSDRAAAAARDRLGEAGFAAAWAAGSALPLEAAVAEALVESLLPAEGPPPLGAPGAQSADRLTPRELQVLRLLAEGRSDREIATALFVSRRTAASHVAGVFRKLGVTSRAAAAAHAVRLGLA